MDEQVIKLLLKEGHTCDICHQPVLKHKIVSVCQAHGHLIEEVQPVFVCGDHVINGIKLIQFRAALVCMEH